MKKYLIFWCYIFLFISCTQHLNENPTTQTESNDPGKQENTVWNKPYPQSEILTLKKCVKVNNNRLSLDIDLAKAIDSLKVTPEAYQDLLKNIEDVNSVIDTAESHSYHIDLSLDPQKQTRSTLESPVNTYYYKAPMVNDSIVREDNSKLKVNDSIVERIVEKGGGLGIVTMSGNSRESFHTDNPIIISATSVNTSVFYWTFMIYDEIWDRKWGQNGMGVFGEGGLEGPLTHTWIYLLVDVRYGCLWKFRTVSSDTDGVKISHTFYQYRES